MSSFNNDEIARNSKSGAALSLSNVEEMLSICGEPAVVGAADANEATSGNAPGPPTLMFSLPLANNASIVDIVPFC